jgi:anti-sigma factor RsiW
MITCADLEDLVADYLDGSLPSRQCTALDDHLDECRACRERLAAYERTIRVAKSVLDNESATAEAPEKLVQAILASLER